MLFTSKPQAFRLTSTTLSANGGFAVQSTGTTGSESDPAARKLFSTKA